MKGRERERWWQGGDRGRKQASKQATTVYITDEHSISVCQPKFSHISNKVDLEYNNNNNNNNTIMKEISCSTYCPKVFISIIAIYLCKQQQQQWGYYHCPHFTDEETELRHTKEFTQGHRNIMSEIAYYPHSLLSEPMLLTSIHSSPFLLLSSFSEFC